MQTANSGSGASNNQKHTWKYNMYSIVTNRDQSNTQSEIIKKIYYGFPKEFNTPI